MIPQRQDLDSVPGLALVVGEGLWRLRPLSGLARNLQLKQHGAAAQHRAPDENGRSKASVLARLLCRRAAGLCLGAWRLCGWKFGALPRQVGCRLDPTKSWSLVEKRLRG